MMRARRRGRWAAAAAVLGLGLGLGLSLGLGAGRVAWAGSPPSDELARLAGQRVEVAADGSYRIVDVAGEGAPAVGVIERRGAELWLRSPVGPARRLRGPLAHPRIAGPGYKVWVTGAVARDGSLVVRRLGVLARPTAKH
ncbi:MAG TPA: hypothetical protein VK698_26330 [Kofleriaceae bacterium]|nr:hypothetical protein [Kofleriaceae bacterium]